MSRAHPREANSSSRRARSEATPGRAARRRRAADPLARLTLRLDFSRDRAVGPGKIRLLELIGPSGSISAAGRAMDMSYRRAWLLIEDLNLTFSHPVVMTQLGGSHGGGATLTPLGTQLIEHYRAMEREAAAAVLHRLRLLQRALAPRSRTR